MLATLFCQPVHAGHGEANGQELAGYARVIFTFDRQIPARLRVVNSVLILEFDDPVTLSIDKIADQLPNYISIARLDPDRKAIRFGMVNRFKADLKPAGEKLFLDILSTRWQGMPPPLPNDVVQELVRRAKDAEEKLRKISEEKARVASRLISLNVGSTPTLKRASFSVVGELPQIAYSDQSDKITLGFEGKFEFELEKARAALSGLAEGMMMERTEEKLTLTFHLAQGMKVRGFQEDESFSLDFSRKDGANVDPFVQAPALDNSKSSSLIKSYPVQVEGAGNASGNPVAMPPQESVKQDPLAQGLAKAIAKSAEAPLGFTLEKGITAEGFALRVQNLRDTPIAILQRRETILVLLETDDQLEEAKIPADLANHIEASQVRHQRNSTLLKLTSREQGRLWLIPEGDDLVIRQENTVAPDNFQTGAQIAFKREFDQAGNEILEAIVGDAGSLHWVDDPASGQRIALVPVSRAERASQRGQTFVEFSIEPTLAGLAVLPLDEAITLLRRNDALRIGHEIRLTFSPHEPKQQVDLSPRKPLLLDLEAWSEDVKGIPREMERKFIRHAAESPKDERSLARLRLAQFYLAQGFYPEANTVLSVLEADDPVESGGKTVLFHRALAHTLLGRLTEANRLLNEPVLAIEPEQPLLQALVDAQAMRHSQAVQNFKRAKNVLKRYPEHLQAKFRPLAIEAGIAAEDIPFAREQLLAYEELDVGLRPPALQQLMAAKIAELQGRNADAHTAYAIAAKTTDRQVEAAARFGLAVTGLAEGKVTPDEMRNELETLSVSWRRGEVELKSLARLGEIYAAEGRWREAFLTAQRATAILPEHPLTRKMEDVMAQRFENIFLDQADEKLSKVETLALYQEFHTLVPPGRRGDEIARRLADRLHDLDLVAEAAEILEHQVNHRLEGLAKSSVATRLALLYLQNHQPLQSLNALRQSRLANLPADLRRARAMLEARALSEVQRSDLAIEILANENGEDIDRLRADIHWKGKHWREAGEGYERLLGNSWQGKEGLSNAQRLDALRAGLAYVLAGERLSNNRLRGKFLPKMSESEDAGTFNLITKDDLSNPQAFREAARAIINADTMSAFLASYRKRFPETSGTRANAPAPAEQAKAPAQPARG